MKTPELGWFGIAWKEGFRGDLEIAHPGRVRCGHCGEEVGPYDSGLRYPDGDYAHRDCHLRCILGSVAHIERRCGCFVPCSTEDDPAGLTKRQAAAAAVACWERQQNLLVN